MKNFAVFTIFLLVKWIDFAAAKHHVPDVLKSITNFRECLKNPTPGVCVKELALNVVNESMYSEKPFSFYGVEIERNPNYWMNASDEVLPMDTSARSLKLNDLLYDKIEEFFQSRTLKFNMDNMDNAVEGRRKKGGKRGNGMLMMGMMGAACMVGQMMMGKIAFLAGTALIIAKVALFLSAVTGLKKLSSGGGGGGETQHVVYASSDGGHSHGGGGGGWHRSIEDGQNLAYKAHLPSDSSNGY